MKNGQKQNWVANGLIILAVLGRLIPHPANMTPIGAVSLVGGAKLGRVFKWAIPFVALMLSDFLLGLFFNVEPWSRVTPFIYAGFAINILLGSLLKGGKQRYLRLGALSVIGSLQFFAITNLGVWWMQSFYPKTVAGIAQCYTLALPFLGNTLAGDIAWSLGLFWAIEKAGAWVQKRDIQTASL